ncbi:hypothetical protein A3J41_02630 [candidate division TM6 bacterium RIFCSPHIGHO2_12_FULL_38_8]|nr:MAG: hypothetical protein A3J41_02630 [candidate division TM6 bacterium RIFCSPHIGHO2_12_FULL_38_8]
MKRLLMLSVLFAVCQTYAVSNRDDASAELATLSWGSLQQNAHHPVKTPSPLKDHPVHAPSPIQNDGVTPSSQSSDDFGLLMPDWSRLTWSPASDHSLPTPSPIKK